MKVRTRRFTSLILAGSILAGGATGLAVSSATAHDNGGQSMGAQQARGGHHAPAAVKAAVTAAVKATLNVDDAALKTARTAGKSLTTLAQEKGVSRDTLVDAIAAALKASTPANAPTLTDAQITARAGKIADHVPGSKVQRASATRTAVGQAIASTLGITVDELKTARKAGTSPATLAQQKGVARDTLVDAVVGALKANRPAGAPSLTDAQITQMAGKIVDNARPAHGPGGLGAHRR